MAGEEPANLGDVGVLSLAPVELGSFQGSLERADLFGGENTGGVREALGEPLVSERADSLFAEGAVNGDDPFGVGSASR